MKTAFLGKSSTVKHSVSEEDGILRNVSVKPKKALWKPNWSYKQDIFFFMSFRKCYTEGIKSQTLNVNFK